MGNTIVKISFQSMQKMAKDPQMFNSSVDCLISLKFGIECERVTADTLQVFTINI